MPVTLWNEESRSRRFGLRLCCLDVRDNDWSDILFVRKDLAESVPGRPQKMYKIPLSCAIFSPICVA